MKIALVAKLIVLHFTCGSGSYSLETSNDGYNWTVVTSNYTTNTVHCTYTCSANTAIQLWRLETRP